MELLNQNKGPVASQSFASTTATPSINVTGASVIAYALTITVTTPVDQVVPSASINNVTSIFTKTAHGMLTGLKTQVATSGALPTPLLVSTDYYVIRLTADTFQLATSLVNALAGTFIDLSDSGTGNQTMDITAIAGGSAQLEKAYSGDDLPDASKIWFPEGSPTAVSATGNYAFEKVDPAGNYYRVNMTLTAGQVTMSGYTLGKGLE